MVSRGISRWRIRSGSSHFSSTSYSFPTAGSNRCSLPGILGQPPPGAMGLAVAAAQVRFMLQACAKCGTVQYPPRAVCGSWQSVQLFRVLVLRQ